MGATLMNGSGSVRLARLALAISLLLSAGCAGSSMAGSPSDRVDAAPSVTPPELIVPTASEPEATRPPSPRPATPAITPTPDALATGIASQQPRAESYPSPDGRWIAEILSYDCGRVSEEQENAYQELRLTEVEAYAEVGLFGDAETPTAADYLSDILDRIYADAVVIWPAN